MAEAAFDTLNMARSLERDYDMPAKQAEGVATLVYTQLSGNVATKEDIARVQEDIARLEQKTTTKVDLAEVRTEIARSSNRQVAILASLIGGLFVINQILPLFGQ